MDGQQRTPRPHPTSSDRSSWQGAENERDEYVPPFVSAPLPSPTSPPRPQVPPGYGQIADESDLDDSTPTVSNRYTSGQWQTQQTVPGVYGGYAPSTYTGTLSQPLLPYAAHGGGYGPVYSYGDATRRQPILARAFSGGLTVGVAVGALAPILVIYLIGVLAVRDWADSARAAGFVGAVLAIVVLGVYIARVVSGRRAVSTAVLTLALIVALLLPLAAGTGLAEPVHRAQASTSESAGAWADAVREYGRAGEKAPNAPDIARAYDEAGEHLLSSGQYDQAAPQFATVLNQYYQSGAAVLRARGDLVRTYTQWLAAKPSSFPFSGATVLLDSYLTRPQCDAACSAQFSALDSQIYFQYGTQLATTHQYQEAAKQFEVVTTRFPKSAVATQAHAGAAQAYYAYGKEQITAAAGGTCSAAVTTYKMLVDKYADTQQGKQAASDLAAPQSVSGQISGVPTNPAPVAVLSTKADPNNYFFSSDYKTNLDTSKGTFTFGAVKQGDYNIAFITNNADGSTLYVYYQDQTSGNLYSVHVGPLCPVNLTLTYNTH